MTTTTTTKRRHVVAGDIEEFIQGQVLGDENIIKYFRSCLNENGTDQGLSDADILAAYDSEKAANPNYSNEDLEVQVFTQLEKKLVSY